MATVYNFTILKNLTHKQFNIQKKGEYRITIIALHYFLFYSGTPTTSSTTYQRAEKEGVERTRFAPIQ